MNYRSITCFAVFLLCCFLPAQSLAAEGINPQHPVMSMYSKVPALLASGAKPSVMLMLDTSWSMRRRAYRPKDESFDSEVEYMGLFKAKSYYTYSTTGKYFEQCTAAGGAACSWSGNFLNWLTMRRIDIAKKVLTGGKTVKKSGNTLLLAEPVTRGDDKTVTYKDNKRNDVNGNFRYMTPYDGKGLAITTFKEQGATGIILSDSDSGNSELGRCRIRIKVNTEDLPVQGIIQETSADIRYGLTIFSQSEEYDKGTSHRREDAEGGVVRQYVGAATEEIVEAINTSDPSGYTPLAETLYTITGYFGQQDINEEEEIQFLDSDKNLHKARTKVGPRYKGTGSYQVSDEWDPFYFNDKKEKKFCSKSFVIMLTDGLPTRDMSIPQRYRDLDGDDNDPLPGKTYPKAGSDHRYETEYLDDVALYAHTTDLRSDLEGVQNLTIYPIFVFGNEPTPPQVLIDAAINGGFTDKNDNGKVDDGEVIHDEKRGLPENLFNARNGKELTNALRDTLGKIKNDSSSGTSVAILNSSVDGSGATFQSVYHPLLKDDNGHGVAWTGDVLALLIDTQGNLREDSNHNQQLDMVDDLIIETITDKETGTISVSMYKDRNGDGLLEKNTLVEEVDPAGNVTTLTVDETVAVRKGLSLDDIAWLWSGGNKLSHIDNDEIETQRTNYLSKMKRRYIFTYIDKNNNGMVDNGEYLPFTTESLAANNAYLGYFLGTESGDGRDFNNDTAIDEKDLQILINYIRGKEYGQTDYPQLRSRRYASQKIPGTHGVDENAVWRLGDIVSSSPIAVQAPFAGYDTLYNSKSYRKFKRKYSARRTVVYTGSNDGIFHAFNGGFYQKEYGSGGGRVYNKFWKHCEKDDLTGELTCSDKASAPALGQELWAYIPQNLLPHLQWLPQKDYHHIFYNDLPSTILEAQLWDKNDPVHVGGWGTLLVGGMRFGGGPIEVTANVWKTDGSTEKKKRIMRSAYFVMDITNPELPPVLLDEFTIDTDDRASFTTVQPSLEYVTVNAKEETRDWYLFFGSGPETLQGESANRARVFVRKLAALPVGAGQTESTQKYRKPGSWTKKESLAAGEFHLFEIKEENSFIGQFYGADFQIGTGKGAFTTDAVYFGTVAGKYDESNTVDKNQWTGKLHRLVIDNGSGSAADTQSWEDKVLFDTKAPVSIKPQVSLDELENTWVFFGTGRFFHALYDKEDTTPAMKFYGVREPMTNNPQLGTVPVYNGDQTVAAVEEKELVDTTALKIYAGATADKSRVVGATPATTFAQLEELISHRQGWVITLGQTGERVIVNPVIRNQMVNVNTLIPSTDICDTGNKGYLYNFFYKTGTAFWRPIMGIDKTDRLTSPGGESDTDQFLAVPGKAVDSYLSSSSFHSGEGELTQTVQKGDGAVEKLPVETPGPHKSGRIFWEKEKN